MGIPLDLGGGRRRLDLAAEDRLDPGLPVSAPGKGRVR